MRVDSTTKGSADSRTNIGGETFALSLFHISPELPPLLPSAFPLTELTCKTNSTFLSLEGAVQVRVQEVWSFPASV